MRCAWGSAILDFDNCLTPASDPDHKLLVDGVECFENVIFIDTETLEYCVLVVVAENGEFFKNMKKASRSLEFIPAPGTMNQA